MALDPYAILGVPRTAGDVEITQAYERQLANAARQGAVKVAQDVDRAYTILRDPYRRAGYDRTGVVDAQRRLPPLERWAPPRAVPFRSWSPADDTSRRPTPCRPGPGPTHRRSVVLLLVVLTVLPLLGVTGRAAVNRARARHVDVPNSSSGWISVVCQPASGAAGYTVRVRAGTAVACTNSASPQWFPASAPPP